MKLKRSIGFVTGVSYCVTTIIGAGILGLPGAAAQLAGNNSVYAWALDFILVIPLLFVFSRLINTVQSAGGIADFVKVAFGDSKLYLFSQGILLITLVIGTGAIALVGSQYLGSALGYGTRFITLTATLLILVPTLINSLGITLGGRVQNVCALVLILFLLSVIAASFTHWTFSGIFTFSSHQIEGTWKAMGLIWFAFTGIEMITFLGEDFRSPRTFILSVITSFLIVGFLYIGLAIALKLSVNPSDPLLAGSPLIAILNNTLGRNFAQFGGFFGFGLILINLTSAILGASRLIFAVGRNGVLLPEKFGQINERGVPMTALWTLSTLAILVVLSIQFFNLSLEPLFLLVSQNWFILYLLAIISFLKLEKTRAGFTIGLLSLFLALVFMSTFSWFVLFPIFIGLLIFLRPTKAGVPYVG